MLQAASLLHGSDLSLCQQKYINPDELVITMRKRLQDRRMSVSVTQQLGMYHNQSGSVRISSISHCDTAAWHAMTAHDRSALGTC